MTPRVVLETERLRFREFTPEDLDRLAALLGDSAVMRFWPRPHTRDEAEEILGRILRRYQERGFSVWAVELKETGEFIGRCGLIPAVVEGREEIEVAYMIAASKWRQGYGSEAAIGIRDWGFANLAVERLISLIVPDNVASIGVARRNGMRLLGTCLHYEQEHVIYGIIRRGWEAIRKGLPAANGESMM